MFFFPKFIFIKLFFIKNFKVLIQVEDRNDNAPRFPQKRMIVRRNESNLLQPLVRVEASDNDLSPEFGNFSLKYNLNKCEPNLYDMYIDSHSGQLSSRLVIDLDTPEIIHRRKMMFANMSNPTDIKSQIEFLSSFNKLVCEISVTDNNLYKPPISNVTLNDTMEIEITIDSVNDNAPEIDLETNLSIEVNEGENTRSEILLRIPVYDKDDATGLVCLFENGMSIGFHDIYIVMVPLKFVNMALL